LKTQSALSGLLALALLVSGGVASAAAAAIDEPAIASGPQVWLRGAFGRVASGPVQHPAGAHPDDAALDTYLRQAPLVLDVAVPFEDLLAVSAVSRPPGDSATEERLSSGTTVFDGPDRVGEAGHTPPHTTTRNGETEHAWRISVPDRRGEPDSLFDITPPAVYVVSDDGEVSGVHGNGCYAYLCSETGGLGPPSALDALRVGVGETLAVRTEDGSGLAGWTGRLTPLGSTSGAPFEATGVLSDTAESMLSLVGLEAAAGQWLLELRVDFDRERGQLWHAYRLIAR
jgi:hypothetical protein